MTLIAFLPLILMVMLGIVAMKINNNKNYQTKERFKMSSTGTKWLLVAYVAVLCVFTIIEGFIPKSEPIYEKVSAQEIKQYDDLFFHFVNGGKEDISSDLLVAEWSKELKSNSFTIVNEDFNWVPINLFIERVETDDWEIKASLYKGIHTMDDLLIRDYMDDIKLNWEDDKLSVLPQENTDISLSFFQHNFIFNQIEDGSADPSLNDNYNYPILYLQIPSSVELTVDESMVQLVD